MRYWDYAQSHRIWWEVTWQLEPRIRRWINGPVTGPIVSSITWRIADKLISDSKSIE